MFMAKLMLILSTCKRTTEKGERVKSCCIPTICSICFYLLQARKTREIALLQRKIDEIPTRAELTQYQRRFVELYNQGQIQCGVHVCVRPMLCAYL